MSDEEDRRALKWRREKWRRRWILKFVERQRIARRWIALFDLVDWCAQSTTTASLDGQAKAREVAYQRTTDSVRKGEFDRDGRSKILYLDTLVTSEGASPRCRLTREQFEVAFDSTATPPSYSLPISVLNCCWLPRELARRWLESHGYRWAAHFEPASHPVSDDLNHAPPVANPVDGPALPAAMRVKPRPPSREKKFWPAADEAGLEWLIDNGCPAPGDGNQAGLERYMTKWLEDHGHQASESTVRRHVARWIKEYHDELNA
jgi:hypothetical protein